MTACFAGLAHARFDLFAGLNDHLLDTGGVDPPVEHKLLHGDLGHLTADGVVAGERHRFWRVVDHEVDARRLF